MALKHRRNKNGGQRVIIFIGSPVTCETKALTKAGRQLKKNNVAIDVILMGENEGNEDKMKELVKAANGTHDNCHLVTIPPGVLPSDILVSSPIVHGGETGGDMNMGAGDAGGGANVANVGGFAEFGGVDPNMDPELAMALRVSMEEERARQERAAASAPSSDTNLAEESKSDAMEVDATATSGDAAAEEPSEEDLLLQQALAMSMNENDGDGGAAASSSAAEGSNIAVDGAVAMEEEEEDEDAAMQMALQMSMQPDDNAIVAEDTAEDSKKAASNSEEQQQQFQDPQFVNQLLGSLPGVDPNDPAIQNALKNLNQQQQKKDGDDDKKDEQK